MAVRREVADALALAGLATRSLDVRTMTEIEALLGPHLPPCRAGVVDAAFLGKDPDARVAALRRHVEPAVAATLLPALRRAIGERMAGPGDGPSAVTLAEAMRTLARWLSLGETAAVGRSQVRAVGKDLEQRAAAIVDGLAGLLHTDDFPDLSVLTFELLRLEAIRWVLEELGDRPGLAAVSVHSRRLAVATLNRASATIEGFVAGHDLMTMFDTVAALSQVDNLIVVVSRVLDAGAEVGEERTAFVETSDEAALARFVAALEPLSDLLAKIAVRAAGRGDVGPAIFPGAVRQLGYLERVCARVRHQARPEALDVLGARLDKHRTSLVVAIGETLAKLSLSDDPARLRLCIDHIEEVWKVLFHPVP